MPAATIPGNRDLIKRWIRRLAAGLIAIGLIAILVLYFWLRGSLPMLEGEIPVSGLSASVTVTRDLMGVAFIEGETRNDIAFATGFVHAQERFFQMDLQRRSAAGELSELFGERALDHDRKARTHRFRHRARRNLELMDPNGRALLEAYAGGVNSGLENLTRPSFEYALLGTSPAAWAPEDALLTLAAMYQVLQDDQGRFERGMGLMKDHLPKDLFRFLTQQGGRWDAPLFGPPLPPEPLPRSGLAQLPGVNAGAVSYREFSEADLVPGSNNWAVSGRFTSNGAALVADDMHLPLRMPNIWYRAGWVHPSTGRRVIGATLPGIPIMVAGSNGRVAWGFTNTQGDWTDVITLEVNQDGSGYLTPDGQESFVTHTETIKTTTGSVETEVRETRWGPVIGTDHNGQPLVLRWVAHDPEGLNAMGMDLETANSVTEALSLGPVFGIPHQNLVAGDIDGNIGWTIAGAVPLRIGLDGKTPTSWAKAGVGWDGYRNSDTHPSVYNPESGRLWTANARVVSGEAFEIMGIQGAALGARQGQIRDGLLAREHFTEQDLLDIQLDDRALFLERWQVRLLDLLDDETVAGNPGLAETRALVTGWSGRAGKEDVGYRLVRGFRLKVIALAMAPFETWLQDIEPEFRLRWISRQIEYPVWAMLEQRPAHLLNPDFASWRALETAALEAVIEPLYADGSLADDTWGETNRLNMRHPLAGAIPPVDWLMSMADRPQDGDSNMPRVARPTFGASERFGIAPGHEESAYFHMPGGQGSHWLSPYFGAGHDDWFEGVASPLLPGETAWTLTLLPE